MRVSAPTTAPSGATPLATGPATPTATRAAGTRTIVLFGSVGVALAGGSTPTATRTPATAITVIRNPLRGATPPLAPTSAPALVSAQVGSVGVSATPTPTPSTTPTAVAGVHLDNGGVIDFGNVDVGTTVQGGYVTITNTGNATLNVAAIGWASADPPFGLDFSGTTCFIPTPPGEACRVVFHFSPNAAGPFSVDWFLRDNAPDSPQHGALRGTGVCGVCTSTPTPSSTATTTPTLTATPTPTLPFSIKLPGGGPISGSSIQLGTLAAGSSVALTLTNATESMLHIIDVAIVGTGSLPTWARLLAERRVVDAADFAIDPGSTCPGTLLSPNQSCSLSIDFTPTGPGMRTATLEVFDNAPGSPQQLQLSAGTAPTSTPTPTSTVTPTATSTATPAATPTPAPTLTSTPAAGGGGSSPGPAQQPGSGPGTLANPVGLIFGNPLGALSLPGPITSQAQVTTQTGGDVLAGNVGISISASALSGVTGGGVTVAIVANPPLTPPPFSPLAPASIAQGGTVVQVAITDANGHEIHTFANPITLAVHPNANDLAGAGGNLNNLTLAYQVDANTPPSANPYGFPIGSWLVFPAADVHRDPATGLISVTTNHLTLISTMTNPIGWVRTLASNVLGAGAQAVDTKPQFSYLQVTEPQVGNRLLVVDPDTNTTAFVDVSAVTASGPPPARGSTAAVRSLVEP